MPPAENCVVVAQGEMGHDDVFRVWWWLLLLLH
jgi:hypothetical protein